MKTQSPMRTPSGQARGAALRWANAESEPKAIPALLHHIPILAGVDEPALRLLWERVRESTASAGSIIVREGEAGNRFYIIAHGAVRVCRHFGQANEIEVARFGPGDFFGEMCILETLPRSATVQAIKETMLYSLTSVTFYNLYEAMPRQHSILVTNIARDLSRRLRRLDEVFAAKH